MEIRINKEIREYEEQWFLGLTLKQCIYAAVSIILSVTGHFIFSDRLPGIIRSWICILLAAIPVFLGFFRYNSLSGEKFLFLYIRKLILDRSQIVYKDKTLKDLLGTAPGKQIIAKNKKSKK